MGYTNVDDLNKHLEANVGKDWPLRETCCRREADRRVALHRAAGRTVLDSVDDSDVIIGFTTFFPAPEPVPADWSDDTERALDITFG